MAPSNRVKDSLISWIDCSGEGWVRMFYLTLNGQAVDYLGRKVQDREMECTICTKKIPDDDFYFFAHFLSGSKQIQFRAIHGTCGAPIKDAIERCYRERR